MDIDEQKRAADMIDAALTQARLANAAKTSFLARMSHDRRTPMNGILGLIEINQAHADDLEFTARNRGRAKVAANYLLSLINDVLQLSKLEDPDVTLSCEAFNVRELAEDIATIITARTDMRNACQSSFYIMITSSCQPAGSACRTTGLPSWRCSPL